MRYLLAIAILIVSALAGSAQESRPRLANNSSPEPARPQLKVAASPEYTDEVYLWGSENVYLRTGKDIHVPLTDSPSLEAGLNSPLSTKGMTGATLNRGLIMRSDILTRYGDKLAVKDAVVEARISGHKSGFKNRAALVVEPRTVELRLTSPVQISTAENGDRIFLKPGTWLLRLHCTIQSVEAENMHWYPSNDNESLVIKGKKFGAGTSGQNAFADPYVDLQYINPFGAFAYSMTKIGKLAGLLFRRPNIDLPPSTQLFFRIDRIEATYLAPPMSADNPTPVK